MEANGRSPVERAHTSRRAVAGRGNGRLHGMPPTRRGIALPAANLVIVAVAVAVLAGGIAAFYEATRPASYRSSAVLLIDQPGVVASSQDDGIIAKLSRLRVRYVDIVGTTVFDQPLAQQVGLPVDEVHSAVRATADATSLLVHITVTLPQVTDARRVAQAAAQQLVSYTQQEQSSAGIPVKQRVTFTVVTPAVAADQVTPDRGRAVLIGAFVFAGVVIVGLLAAELAGRRTIRLD